jgi:DNA processing protein
MKYEIKNLEKKDFPRLLLQISDPPKKLRIQGEFPKSEKMKYLTVVGSRKYSPYGKSVCEYLIEGLKGCDICIISGLALGIDSIAHKKAMEVGLKTIAVPGSGLSDKSLYPKIHLNLRNEILENGGCLLSEFDDNFNATPYSFPQRNRIMAGLSDAVLVIEAELKSGTLITSKFATEYNRDVLTVPQNIFSKTAEGPNMLIKLGATPVSRPEDILNCFGIYKEELFTKNNKNKYDDCSAEEIELLEILGQPMQREEVINKLQKPVHITQTLISILEIKGLIKEEMGMLMIIN